jgi:4'-phosphopantetheinyl transferase EntD
MASFDSAASSGGTSDVTSTSRDSSSTPPRAPGSHLAAHVLAGKVVARIGLGVAGIARLPHQRGERRMPS